MDADLVVPAQIAGMPLKADVHAIALAGLDLTYQLLKKAFLVRMQKQKQLVQRSQPGE